MPSRRKSEFKAPRKTADGKPGDLRRHCEVFCMVSQDEADQEFLAHLYRTIRAFGGTVMISDPTSEKTYTFSPRR